VRRVLGEGEKVLYIFVPNATSLDIMQGLAKARYKTQMVSRER
jgi:hypothetical protein